MRLRFLCKIVGDFSIDRDMVDSSNCLIIESLNASFPPRPSEEPGTYSCCNCSFASNVRGATLFGLPTITAEWRVMDGSVPLAAMPMRESGP